MTSIGLDKHDIQTQLMLADAKANAASTVGFSSEDNCCQSQGIVKLIKKKLLKGIFKVDYLLMSLQIHRFHQVYC